MKILLTGGAGFIGSHTLIELTEAGHEAVVVDNLDNSSPISLKRVAKIIGKELLLFHRGQPDSVRHHYGSQCGAQLQLLRPDQLHG